MCNDAVTIPARSDSAFFERLGLTRLDLEVGGWQAWNDLANYSYVRHPEQDEKHYSRELLRMLGKRFSNAEAAVIWQEVERYRREFVARFGPPQGAVGGPSFEESAREWYTLFGRGFEKDWFLRIPLDLY